jgi:simple sugar transport system permease protein
MTTDQTTRAAQTPAPEGDVLAPRKLKTPILLGAFALVSLFAFVFTVVGETTRIDVSNRGGSIQLDPISVPTMPANLVLTVLMFALAGFALKRALDRKPVPMWITAVFAALWVVALIIWVGAGANVPLAWLLTGTLALSTPIVFGSMAGLVSERSGVVNIAIEGQLLSGAFASALVSSPRSSTTRCPTARVLNSGRYDCALEYWNCMFPLACAIGSPFSSACELAET